MTSPFDLVWGDVSLRNKYGLRVADFDCPPPEPKLSIVSIPGGVDLDLTDALTGSASFENRDVSITFFYDGRKTGSPSWSEVASDVANLLSGVESDFTLSWDPGFTYHGRAQVTKVEYIPQFSCRITVEITASPWRLKQLHTTTVSAVGGVTVNCQGGRRPVHPLVTCAYPVTVNFGGQSFVVPAGGPYRMVDVVLTEGDNEIWMSVYQSRPASWSDVAGMTWEDLSGTRWADVSVPDGDGDGFDGDGTVTLEWTEEYL